MAKRESQGMQITVILLVMLSVLFAITTIVFWNMSKNAKADAEAKRQQASEADQRVNRTITENQNLRRMLGHAEDEDFAAVEKIFNDDMNTFGPSFPKEKSKIIGKLPEYLATINQQLHEELSTASTRVKELEGKVADATKEKEKHIGIERGAKVKAEEEYRAEREKLTAELTQQKTTTANSFGLASRRNAMNCWPKTNSLSRKSATSNVSLMRSTLRTTATPENWRN